MCIRDSILKSAQMAPMKNPYPMTTAPSCHPSHAAMTAISFTSPAPIMRNKKRGKPNAHTSPSLSTYPPHMDNHCQIPNPA